MNFVSSLTAGTKAGYSLYSLGSVNESLDEVYVCGELNLLDIEQILQSAVMNFNVVVETSENEMKKGVWGHSIQTDRCG